MKTRFPRTMQEAFGPHTDFRIYEPMPEYDVFDKLIIFLAVMLFVVVIVGGLWGWVV